MTRGPTTPGEYATLGYTVAAWLEEHGAPVVFDGYDAAGEPVGRPGPLTDAQLAGLIAAFRIAPDARPARDPART